MWKSVPRLPRGISIAISETSEFRRPGERTHDIQITTRDGQAYRLWRSELQKQSRFFSRIFNFGYRHDALKEHHVLEVDFRDEDPIAMDWLFRLFLAPEDGGLTTIPDVTEPLALQMLEIARKLGMPRVANAIIDSMKHNLEIIVHCSENDLHYRTVQKWRWYANNLWPKRSNFRLKYLRPVALDGMVSHASALMRDKAFMAVLGSNKDFRTDLFEKMAKEIEFERAYRECRG